MVVFVIPAKAGIQEFQEVLDPGFRRGDGFDGFLRGCKDWNAIEFWSPPPCLGLSDLPQVTCNAHLCRKSLTRRFFYVTLLKMNDYSFSKRRFL
jgi:hypothetical protein